MNAKEKAKFVTSLCDSVKKSVLASVDRMPEDWDGHELRRYIADKFEHEAWTVKAGTKNASYRRRFRDYRNIVATTPL